MGELGRRGKWGRWWKGCSHLLLSFLPPISPPWLLGDFSPTAKRLLRKATLEQCQQKHLAPVHSILGFSSARPWKLHVGLISQGKGRRQGVRRGKAAGPHVTCHPQRKLVGLWSLRRSDKRGPQRCCGLLLSKEETQFSVWDPSCLHWGSKESGGWVPSFRYRAVCSPFALSPPPSPRSRVLSHSPSHDQSTQNPGISDTNDGSSWEPDPWPRSSAHSPDS